MSVSVFMKQLFDIAEAIDSVAGNTQWYVFGSFLTDPQRAADIDLLVVCTDHTDADSVRRGMDAHLLPLQIDLSIFTIEEEAEINFIAKNGCIPFFPSLAD